jgi:hypothetical protein
MSAAFSSRTLVIGMVGLAALGGGAWGLSAVLGKGEKPAAGPALPDGLSADQIRAQAKEDPGGMFRKMREMDERTDLSEEQKEAARRNLREVMEGEMQARVDEYYAAGEADREAILDKQIDEMQKMMERERARREAEEAEMKEKSEEEQKKEEERRRERMRRMWAGRSQSERKAESEQRDPNQMAQRMAYFAAMRKRMEARGIQPPRWGPMGRGGPGGGRRGG